MNELLPITAIFGVFLWKAISYKARSKPVKRTNEELRRMYFDSIKREQRLQARWNVQNGMAYADYSITIPEATAELHREKYYFGRIETQRKISENIYNKIKNND